MKKLIIILLIILFCGLFSFAFFASKYDSSIQDSSEINLEEIIVKKMDLEGYNNLTEWLNVYKSNIEAYKGRTTSVKLELEEYMTEEQKQQMFDLENQILNAKTIKEQEQAKQVFNSILEEINIYRAQIENTVIYDEPVYEETYVEEFYYEEPVNNNNNESYDPYSFKSQGVIYENGTKYTWYSQNVLPGGGLDIPGRHVGDDNLIYDADGYVVVASDDYAKGVVVDTPFGEGKVYDSGCDSGTIDIYTNF